jgi:hypothetical protein
MHHPGIFVPRQCGSSPSRLFDKSNAIDARHATTARRKMFEALRRDQIMLRHRNRCVGQ